MNTCMKSIALATIVAATYEVFGVTPVPEGDNLVFTVGSGAEETYADPISGSVGVIKRGAGTLTLTGVSSFTGKLSVEAGILKSPIKTICEGHPPVEVIQGATLDLSGEAGSANESWSAQFPSLTVSGAGVDGKGAVVKSSGNQNVYRLASELHLNGDATLNIGACGNKLFQFGKNIYLNGHRLTKKGAGIWYFQNNSFKNNDSGSNYGSIEIAEGELYVQQGNGFTGSEKNVLRMNGGTVRFVEYSSTQYWSMEVVANSTLITTGVGGPFECKWNGPVALTSGNLTLTVASNCPLTFNSDVTGSKGCGISKGGPGLVKVKGNLTVLTTGAWDGILAPKEGGFEVVGGTEHKITGNIYASGKTGYLAFRNAGAVRLQTEGGSATDLAGTQATPQKLTVENTTVNSAGRSTVVGMNGNWGLLEIIGKDTAFNGPIDLGYSGGQGGHGALLQRGGNVTAEGDFKMSAKTDSSAYLRVEDGVFQTPGKFLVGESGFAMVDQHGGTVKTTSDYMLRVGKDVSAVFRNAGGLLSARYVDLCQMSAKDGSVVLLSSEGERTTNAFTQVRACATNAVGAVLAMNDGGILKVQRLFRSDDVKDVAENRSDFVLSFNGGGIAPAWDGDICNGYAAARRPNVVLVHEKGAIVDGGSLNSSGSPSVLPFPLVSPTGLVIDSIALPTDEAFAKDVTYLGAPQVKITGDGKGAAAVAEYDPMTRQVTNIVVVAPGTGFTTAPTVTISSSDGKKDYVCVATMKAALTTGTGLVKRGKWPIQLNAANTYKGPTVLEMGSIAFAATGSLPEGSGLVFADGTSANFQGGYGTSNIQVVVPTLEGSGKVDVWGVWGKGVKVTGELKLHPEADKKIHIDGPLYLADGVTISCADVTKLDETKKNVVLDAANGGIIAQGRVAFSDLPEGWKISIRGNELCVRKQQGVALIVR